jgi:hypothetical protein
MSVPIDREGTFRGVIVEYGLREMESGSRAVCVSICAQIHAKFDGEEWEDWTSYDVEARGDVWVVKKDGTLNLRGSETLVKHAGWDGKFTSVVQGTWQPTPCQFVVKKDEYNDEIRYRIDFVNDFDRTPGEIGNVDAERAKALENQYGSQMRALFANARHGTSKPAEGSKPSAPPAPAPAKEQQANRVLQETAVETNPVADEIPF